MYVLPAVASVVFGALVLYFIYGFRPPLRVTFERLQQLSGADVANFTQLSILGAAGNFQTINGTWELLQDLDNSWSYFIRVSFQPPGDHPFYHLPLPFHSVGVCDLLKSPSYEAFWNHHQYSTNYPDPKNASAICPFPKGAYYLRTVPLNPGYLPWVSKPGLYRMDFCLAKGGETRMTEARGVQYRELLASSDGITGITFKNRITSLTQNHRKS